MVDTVRIFVGFDPREAVAYHVFSQSLIAKATKPIAIHPLHRPMLENFDGQRDGTNAFIFSRYLVPYLCDYKGWALFFDGDMVCKDDVARLWAMRHPGYAVQVVKHDYKTRNPRKYIGTPIENDNVDYPRKNWSSVVMFNCAHPSNAVLTPEFVSKTTPQVVHRFGWLKDSEIGELPHDWNLLVGEDPPGPASVYHYTLGIPGIRYYVDSHASWNWHGALLDALECAGQSPTSMVERAENRIGDRE